jgi:hypothetical protein
MHTLPLAAIPPQAKDYHLLVPHALRRFQPIDPNVTKL